MTKTPRRYPLEPLLALTGWSIKRVREIATCNGVEYQIRLTVGVTELVADRLAVAAGVHPWTVWPEMGERAVDEAERPCGNERCPIRFVSCAARRRYCSPSCRNAAKRRRYYRSNPATTERLKARQRAYDQEVRLAALRRRSAIVCAAPDCEVLFVPERADRLYHHARCAKRVRARRYRAQAKDQSTETLEVAA